jgi:hypothetical protein
MEQQLTRIEKQLKELRSAQTETLGNGKAREVGTKEGS